MRDTSPCRRIFRVASLKGKPVDDAQDPTSVAQEETQQHVDGVAVELDEPPTVRACAGLPLDDVVDLDYLWWTGELDAALGEDRHQALTERLELVL